MKACAIDVHEFAPGWLWLERYAPSIAGEHLVQGMETGGNVFNTNRLSASGPALGVPSRIAGLCAMYNITLLAIWIPRELNQLRDACSKARDYHLFAGSPIALASPPSLTAAQPPPLP